MKILERIALILFSIIMMIIAVTSCLVIFNVVELKSIFKFLEETLKNETASKIILGCSAIAILLSIKSLFFPSKMTKKQEIKTGVLLENKDGRLLISRDTIENLVNSVVKSFNEAIDIQTKINLDSENNITVYISLLVREDAVISELSSNIQNRIKETIKRNTGLEVDQININVKDIENTKSGLKSANQARLSAGSIKASDSKTYETNQLKSTDDNVDTRYGVNNSMENSIIIEKNSAMSYTKKGYENTIENTLESDTKISTGNSENSYTEEKTNSSKENNIVARVENNDVSEKIFE